MVNNRLPTTARPECQRCDAADAKARGFVRGLVVVGLLSLRARHPSPTAQALAAYGQSMRLMLGAALPPSGYQEHKDAYVATGDLSELERMLRHVAEEYPI